MKHILKQNENGDFIIIEESFAEQPDFLYTTLLEHKEIWNKNFWTTGRIDLHELQFASASSGSSKNVDCEWYSVEPKAFLPRRTSALNKLGNNPDRFRKNTQDPMGVRHPYILHF